jgi:hypothetical protein
LSPARKADRDLDGLIEEITVDCDDEYEQLTGFENALDEDGNFPLSGDRCRGGGRSALRSRQGQPA